jgi:hypothetical protein
VCRASIRRKIAFEINQPDLAITAWGYANDPPTQPYWSSPDIWGTPKTGQAKNDLYVRVRNVGKAAAPAFKVRVSFVPFTGVIDLANEILIEEVSRAGLSAMATDVFIVNWDLTAPKLPSKYADFEHFCVIAEIKASECNTTNHRAQSNFTIVPSGQPPPPLMFEIANPWDEPAELSVDLVSHDRRMKLHPIDFDPYGMVLEPRERRRARVGFELSAGLAWDPDAQPAFDITQRLDGQVVGGMSGVVVAQKRQSPVEVACPRCSASYFVFRLTSERDSVRIGHGGDVIVSCGRCGNELLHAMPTGR